MGWTFISGRLSSLDKCPTHTLSSSGLKRGIPSLTIGTSMRERRLSNPHTTNSRSSHTFPPHRHGFHLFPLPLQQNQQLPNSFNLVKKDHEKQNEHDINVCHIKLTKTNCMKCESRNLQGYIFSIPCRPRTIFLSTPFFLAHLHCTMDFFSFLCCH